MKPFRYASMKPSRRPSARPAAHPAAGRRLFRTAAGLALVALAAGVVACTESFGQRCCREAREYTERQCPRLEHRCIRLDSMTYTETPAGFVFHYHVLGELDDRALLTPDKLQDFADDIRQGLRQNISLKTYKEHGLTFTYRYLSSADDSLFLEASFGPEDYR